MCYISMELLDCDHVIGKLWEDVAMAYYKGVSQHLSRGTEENN